MRRGRESTHTHTHTHTSGKGSITPASWSNNTLVKYRSTSVHQQAVHTTHYHKHSLSYTLSLIHTISHTLSHTITHSHSLTLSHYLTHSLTHAHSHKRTHTHTHTDSHAHTRASTHAHTRPLRTRARSHTRPFHTHDCQLVGSRPDQIHSTRSTARSNGRLRGQISPRSYASESALTARALPDLTPVHMQTRSKGCIINVSSVNGMQSFAGTMAYCASKAALDQMTRCGLPPCHPFPSLPPPCPPLALFLNVSPQGTSPSAEQGGHKVQRIATARQPISKRLPMNRSNSSPPESTTTHIKPRARGSLQAAQ